MKKSYQRDIKKFGTGIKFLREKNSFTQQKLSDLCDLDIRTIQRIEKGDHSIGLHILYALADSFKLSLPELLKEIEHE